LELLEADIIPVNPADISSDEEGKGYQSSEIQSSDTSDPDEAGDIDELLNPGHPVYFNYPLVDNIPASIIVGLTQLININVCILLHTVLSRTLPIC